MPLVRITVPQGVPAERRRALADGVHGALVETASVPPDDRFQVIEEVPPDNLIFSRTYLGLAHTGPMAFVQIFLNQGRTVDVKKALYARIADAGIAAGFRREDVLVNLVEVTRENWCFGGGVMSYPPAP
ncbi:MAG: tautomerase family protein [Acidobacteria bacterium]|nr:tautomerase family protein [Acidobacteriota bacterium]